MRGMDLVSPFYMWVQFFCASWERDCLFPSVCFLIFAQISCGSLYFFIYSMLLLLAWLCNRTKNGSKTDIGLFARDYFGCLRFWAYQWEVEFLFLFWWNVIGIFWWGQRHCCAALFSQHSHFHSINGTSSGSGLYASIFYFFLRCFNHKQLLDLCLCGSWGSLNGMVFLILFPQYACYWHKEKLLTFEYWFCNFLLDW